METILLLTIAFSGILIGYFLRNISTRSKIKTIGMPKQEKPAEAQIKKEEPADGNLLERKILLEETITILRELNENLSSYASLNELTDDIVKTTARIFNLNTCSLLLLNSTNDTLEMYSYIGQENNITKNLNIKLGEEISGVVARYNEIKIINNLEANKRVFNLKLEGFYRNSLASVPLSYKGKVIGVINASDKKTGKSFTDNDSEILKLISSESAIAIQNFRLFLELQENYLKTVITLAKAVDAKDPYTHMHSQNVARYSVRLAKHLGLSTQSIETIQRAGLLHDIGKIAVKDEILQKPGKLTDEEYAHIKIHSVKGAEIIKSLPFLGEASNLIRHHHERYDGKGYPDGIKGTAIELGSRIMAIADSVDAMTTDRPYRKALSIEEAKAELIKNKGTQFDPDLAEAFVRILNAEPQIITK